MENYDSPWIGMWWGHLSRPQQMWLLDHTGAELPADVLLAIGEARRIAAEVRPTAQPADLPFDLTAEDVAWIRGIDRPSTEHGFWDPEGRWNPTSRSW